MNTKVLSNLILVAYGLMMIVSLVSAVDLFGISHPDFGFGWMMSVAIEISIAVLLMINRAFPNIKSVLYVLGAITLFQVCANTYSAYMHIDDITSFAELFGLEEWDVIDQKRTLAFATGGILPIICLSLIYIQNETRKEDYNKDIKIEEDKDIEHIDTQQVTESVKSNEHLNIKNGGIDIKEDVKDESVEDAIEGTEKAKSKSKSKSKSKATAKTKTKTISANKPAKKKATGKAKPKAKSKRTSSLRQDAKDEETKKSGLAKDESTTPAIEERDIKDNNESVGGLVKGIAGSPTKPKKESKVIYGDYFGDMYVR